MLFKVFKRQWAVPPAEVMRALARRPDFMPIVLERRCIDSYVSLRKAETVGRFKGVDTTDVPVTIDPAAYERWAEEARSWYRLVEDAFTEAGRPPLRLRYETDVDLPPARLSAHWAKLLQVTPTRFELDASLTVQRQDRAVSSSDKVVDYGELATELGKRGLLREAEGYFLPLQDSAAAANE
jgi:hypothetical protein